MALTTIDVDDALVSECMARFGLPTKQSAIDFALRRLLASASDTELIYATAGIGWEGPRDLDEDANW